MKKSVFIFIFSFVFIFSLYAKEIAKIKYYTFKLEFNKANELIQSCKKKESTKIQALYYENYILFFKALFSQTKNSFENYLTRSTEIYDTIESLDTDSPYQFNTLSQIKFHDAVLNYLFGNTLSASWAFYSSYKLNKENLTKFPNFKENLKLYSIYNIVFSSVPDDYKWLLSTFNIKADLTTGLKGLEKYYNYYQNDSLQSVESTLIYTLALMQFSQNKLESILELIPQSSYKTNSLLRYIYCLTASVVGKSNILISVIENNKQKLSEYPIAFFNYLLGNQKLNNLELETAKTNFLFFLKSYKGGNYLKVVYQRLAWISFLQGDMEGYTLYSQKVLNRGCLILEKDKQSEKEIRYNSKLNKNLLSARLLFDGANYNKSLIELYKSNYSQLNLSNKIEYNYREARIYQKLGEPLLAIKNYKKTISLGKNSKLYFAPYASIFLAEIYAEEKNFQMSNFYYDLALELNNGDYKNSIEVKAKRGKSSIAKD